MTSSNDRRHRLQQYPVPVLNHAIDSIIYKPQDRAMLRDMYVDDDLTYEAAAEKHGYSRNGMLKHMGRLTDRVETYLKDGRLN